MGGSLGDVKWYHLCLRHAWFVWYKRADVPGGSPSYHLYVSFVAVSSIGKAVVYTVSGGCPGD